MKAVSSSSAPPARAVALSILFFYLSTGFFSPSSARAILSSSLLLPSISSHCCSLKQLLDVLDAVHDVLLADGFDRSSHHGLVLYLELADQLLGP